MPETHINAYEMDVQEKLEAVQKAQAEYQAALDRWEAKKQALGIAEAPTQPVEPEPSKPKLLGKK